MIPCVIVPSDESVTSSSLNSLPRLPDDLFLVLICCDEESVCVSEREVEGEGEDRGEGKEGGEESEGEREGEEVESKSGVKKESSVKGQLAALVSKAEIRAQAEENERIAESERRKREWALTEAEADRAQEKIEEIERQRIIQYEKKELAAELRNSHRFTPHSESEEMKTDGHFRHLTSEQEEMRKKIEFDLKRLSSYEAFRKQQKQYEDFEDQQSRGNGSAKKLSKPPLMSHKHALLQQHYRHVGNAPSKDALLNAIKRGDPNKKTPKKSKCLSVCPWAQFTS